MTSLVSKADVFFSDIVIQNTEHHLNRLIKTIPWEYPKFYGRTISRGVCSMGKDYAFSGIVMKAQPWDKQILALMNRINEVHGTSFNACLLNMYPAGIASGISKHSDDEDSLVANPVVVSVSLGESCDFILRGKGSNSEFVTVPLKDGDVLVMNAGTQKFYPHSITKKVPKTTRISLTFRCFV